MEISVTCVCCSIVGGNAKKTKQSSKIETEIEIKKSQRTSIHICNSHEPTRKPKIAKEYAFLPPLEQETISLYRLEIKGKI